MANPAHVEIVKQGARVIAMLRQEQDPRFDLTGADLTGAVLVGADLARANLTRADLTFADLTGAQIRRTNLSGADFTGALLGGTLLDTDLSGANGLGSIRHGGPSRVSVDTLRSPTDLPDEFLRGVGLPDEMILLYHQWQGAIQFYSCFISYSTADQVFADRLYAGLQAKGVRCWLATEHLKTGDRFRQQIDEAIRRYDKLVVVLSETSMASEWVEDEVEAALEKEKKSGQDVLFPIQLDDAVIRTDAAWAAKIRRQRHIGDFMEWKDADAYATAFDRLVRDLKTERQP